MSTAASEDDWRARAIWMLIGFKVAVYLPVELLFNGAIVDIVANGAATSRLHGMELLGRTTSALAAVFLVWRFLVVRASHKHMPALLVSSFAIVFVLVFFAQKALVNWVADSASPEQRYAATLLRFAPRAIEQHKLVGFEFADDLRDPGARTFRAIAGAALFFSATASQDIERQSNKFAYNEALRSVFDSNTDRAWSAYRKLRDETVRAYQGGRDPEKNGPSYIDAGERLAGIKAHPEEEAEKIWHDVNASIAAAWSAGVAQGAPAAQPTADALYHELIDYFQTRNSALGIGKRAREAYQRRMMAMFGRPLADVTWCSDEHHCPGNVEFVERKMKELGGAPAAPPGRAGTAGAFDLSSLEVNREARARFKAAGIDLSDGWTLADKDGFMRAAVPALVKTADDRYRAAMKGKLGDANVAPGLSYEQFEKTPAIQSKLRRAMARELHSAVPAGPLSLLWTRAQFDDKVLTAAGTSLRDNWIGDVATYADGQSRSAVGTDSIRVLMVPMVSICLSLYFVLTNAMSVAALVATRIRPAWTRGVTRAFMASWLLAIPILPFCLPIGVARHEGYDLLAEKTQQLPLADAVAVLPIKWALRLEPVVLQVADTTQKHLFDPTFALSGVGYCRLTAVDHFFIGWLPGSGKVQCEPRLYAS